MKTRIFYTTIIALVLFLWNCEKQTIKNDYAGTYNCISINEDFGHDSVHPMGITTYDTIPIDVEVKWVEDKTISILFSNLGCRAIVDDQGHFTLEPSTNEWDPHEGASFSGSFNDGFIEFNYYKSYSYGGLSSVTKKNVSGEKYP